MNDCRFVLTKTDRYTNETTIMGSYENPLIALRLADVVGQEIDVLTKVTGFYGDNGKGFLVILDPDNSERSQLEF